MYYKKIEKYSFTMPREYKAYLAFKDRLRESGVTFLDLGGNIEQVVEIHTSGRFTVDDNGEFDKEVK